MKKVYCIIFAYLLCATSLGAQEISIRSSNQELVDIFNWAKVKARSFVMTGKRGPVNIWKKGQESNEVAYIPSYWAGYPLRTAFYSRDYCHQAGGAHFLGLYEENFTMMKAFATSADAGKKWYPLWAINFDGSIYTLDYRGDDSFVREVPAAFELVEKAHKLYCLTGDKRYITDEVLWNYYTKVVTEFISLHDSRLPNGVAEGTGEGDIFKGSATFNEGRDVPFVEAGDGIACQYKAFCAYAEMAKLRGENSIAKDFTRKAEALKKYFNTDWGVKNTKMYNRGYSSEGKNIDGWGKENSWFMLMKELTDASSPRTSQYIEFVNERLESKEDIPENIEALSYVPEVFFMYNRNEYGWRWMKHIMKTINETHAQSGLTGTNGNYPEVSYVLIANVVENLAGVTTDAVQNSLLTTSHLPNEVSSLTVENVNFGNSTISITHEGQNCSTLIYLVGKGKLTWNATFAGKHDYLYVNGEKTKCSQVKQMNVPYSVCQLTLQPGETVDVTTQHN